MHSTCHCWPPKHPFSLRYMAPGPHTGQGRSLPGSAMACCVIVSAIIRPLHLEEFSPGDHIMSSPGELFLQASTGWRQTMSNLQS